MAKRKGQRHRPQQPREFLVEFIPVGRYVKVSAIEPITNTEVSIAGPVDYDRDMLSRIAIRKLEYVLAKRGGRKKPPNDSPKGPGILV